MLTSVPARIPPLYLEGVKENTLIIQLMSSKMITLLTLEPLKTSAANNLNIHMI